MGLFETQLARGKKGEELFAKTMVERGHIVEDLRDDEKWRKADVDFSIDGRLVEVKTDYRMNQTGNIFLENGISYAKGGNRDGWFKQTQAEYLAFVDAKTNKIYIYPMELLKEFVEGRLYLLRQCDDGYKIVYGYCVPKNAVAYQLI